MSKRQELIDRKSWLLQRTANPQVYHIPILQIGKMQEEVRKIDEELQQLPPEIISRGTLDLKTEVKYSSNFVNIFKVHKAWKVQVLDESKNYDFKVEEKDGIPIKLFFSYIGSESGGEPVHLSYDLVIDRPVQRVIPKPPVKVPETPTWKCTCGVDNLLESLRCIHCGKWKDSKTAKDFGINLDTTEQKTAKTTFIQKIKAVMKK